MSPSAGAGIIEIKSPSQIQIMREAGRVVQELLELLKHSVKPGVTTLELDELARVTLNRLGAQSAFKGYRGYPAHICTSVNDEVVHGIPSHRRLKAGDIIGVDAGSIVDGYYSDAAVTLGVGEITLEAQDLLEVTEAALMRGIDQARDGNRLSDISNAIQTWIEAHGYSVVREFVGHGIGTQLHEAPQIPNYGAPGYGPILKAGMVLAIEPMVNLGHPEVRLLSDSWTAVTRDGSLSAHFEHTIVITDGEAEILTGCRKKPE
jgi:methionyl aminopeptidase